MSLIIISDVYSRLTAVDRPPMIARIWVLEIYVKGLETELGHLQDGMRKKASLA